MVTLFYFSIAAIIAVTGCQDDILLTPENVYGDTASGSLSNLADGRYDTYWRGPEDGEYVYFYFAAKVQVKWIFIQRYASLATYVQIWDGSTTIGNEYFGDSSESYDTMTLRFNDVQTDILRFYFYRSGDAYISRLEVHGCFDTSKPTTSPTTRVPTVDPTSFPTVSPTLPPVTLHPSKAPTTLPTTAPTESPSTAKASLYPSTHPSWSPTVMPSVETVIPSPSPSFSPTTMMLSYTPSVAPSPSPTMEPTIVVLTPFPSTSPSSSPTEAPTVVYADSDGFQIALGAIELLCIVISCMCVVVLVLLLSYRKAMQINETLHTTAGKVNQTGNPSYNAEDNVIQIESTRYKVADNVTQTSNPRVRITQTNNGRNICGERTEPRDQHVDIRFALDKVSSDNDKVFNRKGDLEIGPQDSAL